jgi:hypothetical protein
MEEFIFTGDILCDSILFIREDRENNTLKEEDPNYNIKTRKKENRNYNNKKKGNSLRKTKYSDQFVRNATLGVNSIINKKAVSKRLAYSLYLLSTNRKCNKLLGGDFFDKYLEIKTEIFKKPNCKLKTNLSDFKIENKSIAFIIYILTSFYYINNLPFYITPRKDGFSTKYNKNYFLYPRLIDNFLLHNILMILNLIENKRYSPNLIITEHNKLMKEYKNIFSSFECNISCSYLLIKDSKTSRIAELTAPVKYCRSKNEDTFYKIFKQFENLNEKELADIIKIIKSLFSSSSPTDEEWKYLKKELFITKSALHTEQSKLQSQCSNILRQLPNNIENIEDSIVELQSKLYSFNTNISSLYDYENYLTGLRMELTYLKEITLNINSTYKDWKLLIKNISILSENVKLMLKNPTKVHPFIFDEKADTLIRKLNSHHEHSIPQKIDKILNLIYEAHLTKEPSSFIKKNNQIKKLTFHVLKHIGCVLSNLCFFSNYIVKFYETPELFYYHLIYDDELCKYENKVAIDNDNFKYYNDDDIYRAFSLLDITTPNDPDYDFSHAITKKFTRLIELKYSTMLKVHFDDINKMEIIRNYKRLIDCENFISQTKIIIYNKNIKTLINSIKKNNNDINIINIEFFQSKLDSLNI